MPTYTYKCPNCGAIHNVIHLMNEDKDWPCPDCNINMVRKPMTNTRPTFKGEGFYTTDKFTDR